ncbi:hypothetical protein FO519_002471 [Halicephalobus sp. NKZ332]|nr:hypothetical protein FO519_002471 [Halicephalobus sp. NKZ332]
MDVIAGDASREHRFAIKQAGFNLLFLMLGGVVLSGLYAVYRMMDMFLLPVTWAFLLGTVLFPIKYRLDVKFKGWLNHLDNTDTPLLIGIARLPYDHFTALSDWMFDFASSRNGVYFGIFAVVLKLINYGNTLSGIFYLIGRGYQYIDSVLQFLNYSSWIFPLILLYAVSYGAWLYVQDPASIHKKFARVLSLPIWIYALAYISDYGGPFRVLIFATTSAVLGLISAGVIDANDDETNEGGEKSNEALDGNEFLPDENPPEANDQNESFSDAVAGAAANIADQLPTLDDVTHPISSDRHIQVIMGLVFTVWMIKHEFLLILFSLPLLFAVWRKLNQRLGVSDGLKSYGSQLWEHISLHANKMFTIIVAGPLRKFLKILFTSDRFMISTLKAKSDVLATVFVMFLLASGSLFCVFFVIFEIHSETVHLVRLGSDVVSNNPEWLKYVVNYTDSQLKEHNIDDYVEQAYQQGRTWLASNVRSLANPKDGPRADELEDQAMLLIDQFYKLWEERNLQTNNASAKALSNTGDLMDHISHITNLRFLQKELTAIVKDNIDTVLSIAQSLWAVVIVNISALSTIVFAILGFVFSFGFDMMNLFIEAIVFLTMVFYLLSYSSDRWLPLQWMEILASSVATSQHVGNRRADIISAIESAISGVFVLSAKMALFYGLYTYFVHSLFNLNVIFIPSLLAALFAAIPILPAYSVLIFGAIELYFIRQETVAAVVFSILSVAPIGFADAAFYREVKNSHPYVTGLAIIGGMYWLGLQGAIFGPIILCSMVALVNVYAQPLRASVLIPFLIPNKTFLTELDLSGIALNDNLFAKILLAHQHTLRKLKAWTIENLTFNMYNVCHFLKSRNVCLRKMEHFSVNQIMLLITPVFKSPQSFPNVFYVPTCFSSAMPSTSASESSTIDDFSRLFTGGFVDPNPVCTYFPGPRVPVPHILGFMPNLSRLTIYRDPDANSMHSEKIDDPDEFLNNLVISVSQLQHLEVVHWPKPSTHHFLLNAASHLTNLTLREFTGLDDFARAIGGCRELLYLDVSFDIRHPFDSSHPHQTLFRMVRDLQNLQYLDISGTNLYLRGSTEETEELSFYTRQKSDILALRALPNKLEYLGLYGCGNAGSFSDLPAKNIFSSCSEDQLLITLDVYLDRQPILFHALNEIYYLYRNSTTCNRPSETLNKLMKIMKIYPDDHEILTAVTAAVFYLLRRSELSEDYKKQITRCLFEVLQNSYKNQAIVRNVCLTLCQFDFPLEVLHCYVGTIEKLIRSLTIHTTDRFTHQVVIFVMNSLASFLNRDERVKVGQLGAIQCMVQEIQKCCHDIGNDRVMEVCWSFLWNITDETPENCEIFLDLEGIKLISDVYEMFPNEIEVIRNMFGMLGNVSEIERFRERLVEPFTPILYHLLTISQNNMEVTYNVAAVLANLLSEGEETWFHYDCRVKYRDVYNKMITCVKQWNVVERRITNYHTLKPIIKLLACENCYASQVWAAWALVHLATEDEKYSDLFIKDKGMVPYVHIRKTYHQSALIHKFLDQLQQRLTEHHTLKKIESPSWLQEKQNKRCRLRMPIEEFQDDSPMEPFANISGSDDEAAENDMENLNVETLYIFDVDTD